MKTRRGATFVGVDLAWAVAKNASGVAILRGDLEHIELETIRSDVVSIDEIASLVALHQTETTVVAIDAPLVVANETGQRPCETEIGRRFGRYGASCHSTNLARPNARNGGLLLHALGANGFHHDFRLDGTLQRPGRWVFETYPHPAMVRIWELPQIIRYKKGRIAAKRAGLECLQRYLATLTQSGIGVHRTAEVTALLSADVGMLRGRALKRHEDSLDAFFCAFLAWHCWRWGVEGNEMIGEQQTGYIVVPRGRGDPAASADYRAFINRVSSPLA